MPGFVAARRYRVHEGGAEPAYLAVYEIDAEDLTGPVREMRARTAAGEMHMSDALQLDPPPVVTFYELIE